MARPNALRRIAITITAAIASVSLAACSNPLDTIEQAVSAPTVEEAQAAKLKAQVTTPTILTEGTLTVGIESSESAPMCITGQDGSYQGYDVDFAAALGDYLGLKVKFVSISSSSEVGTTCDIAMSIKSDHSSGLTLCGNYAEEATAFFTRGSAASVANLYDLEDKTIGVQENSTSQQYLKRSNVAYKEATYANLNEAFEALENGEVDYILCSAFPGAYLAEVYSDIVFAGTIDVPSNISVAVATSNTELQTIVQEAVAQLTSNGVSQVIRNKWIDGLETLTSSSQIEGISISSTVSTGTSETTEVSGGASGVQDGSNAGANAVDVNG